MYSIENREDLENLNELVSLSNHVDELRLQDKLRKHNFHENLTKVFEPLTDTIKGTYENLTKIIGEISDKNNKTVSVERKSFKIEE